MNSLLQRVALIALLSAVAGCSTIKDTAHSVKDTVGGWFGGSNMPNAAGGKAAGGNTVPSPDTKTVTGATAAPATEQSSTPVITHGAPSDSATAGLQINTSPQRAKVYVDGVSYGLSPLHLAMEPGTHTISVKLEGYKMVTEKISAQKGDNTEMTLNLSR